MKNQGEADLNAEDSAGIVAPQPQKLVRRHKSATVGRFWAHL